MEGNNSNSNATGQIINILYNNYLTLSFVAISFLTVIENIVGMVVIRVNPVLHTTANKFVCSMAVTDIITGVCLFFAHLFLEFAFQQFFPGTNFLPEFTVIMTIGYCFMCFSMVHMTIIAFERYVFIAHPFVYRRRVNGKTIAVVIAMFWLFCVIYMAVLFGGSSFAVLQNFLMDSSASRYTFISFYIGGSIYLICSILTAIAYGLIVKVALNRNRFKRERNQTITQTDESSKNALKTIKFFMVVYGMFAIFTMPVFLYNILSNILERSVDFLFQALTLPLIVIPGMNFFVLTVLNADFRSALKKTLAGLCRRHR